jgi:hypothetical protein
MVFQSVMLVVGVVSGLGRILVERETAETNHRTTGHFHITSAAKFSAPISVTLSSESNARQLTLWCSADDGSSSPEQKIGSQLRNSFMTVFTKCLHLTPFLAFPFIIRIHISENIYIYIKAKRAG